MSIPLSVKWGKETVEIQYDPDTGTKGLKSELREKTNVPEARQKLMAKSKGLWKGVLKDDAVVDWQGAVGSGTGGGGPIQLLLMGSAEALTGPKVKTVFLEDMPADERAKVAEPAGLVNLGNTCYLNSVVQCLRAVPELRKSLTAYQPSNDQGKAFFVNSLRNTYRQLDSQEMAVQPMALVQAVKAAFPQFAELSPQGHPMQQDAEEFYSGLLTLLASETQSRGNMSLSLDVPAAAAAAGDQYFGGASNTIDALFGIKMTETLTCDEFSETDDPREPPVVSTDLHRKLVCNIMGGADGNSAKLNVNHVQEGIALGLTGQIEKNSGLLGRDAVWTRRQRIQRLPPIITVQFGRFYWKVTPDAREHAGVKCKVMKPVAFSTTLDVYDFCTPEIQAVLMKARKKALAAQEDAIAKKLTGQTTVADGTQKTETEEKESAMIETEDVDDEDLQAALAMSLGDGEESDVMIGPGIPKNFQGYYELFAVVTHKGRDADGGHYMAWVKAAHQGDARKRLTDIEDENEEWFVYDDDEVSPCKTEDVLKLKGGGDWHMSYLNFYRIKK